MNLSRRQFLQGMLAVAGAANMPSLPFNDIMLDAPISEDVPFAHVTVANVQVPCKSMSLEMSYGLHPFDYMADLRSYTDTYMDCTLTLEASLNQALYNAYVGGKSQCIAVSVPGSGMVFSGDFVLTDFTLLFDGDDEQCIVTAKKVNNGAARPLEIRITTM